MRGRPIVLRRIASAADRPRTRPLAVALAAALLATAHASGGFAQTPFSSLAAPNGPPAVSRSPAAAQKPEAAVHGKPCSDYGAGFVNVPGTDTCVKVGTAVRTDAAVSSHR